MIQRPLTTTGAADKVTELYALSQTALDIEATRIQNELAEWMDDNFILNTLQRTYLSTLDAGFNRYLSSEIAASVRTRQPISLIIPATPPVSFGTKRIILEKETLRSIDSGVVGPLSGLTTITVTYR